MAKKRQKQKQDKDQARQSSTYTHGQEAVQRPDVGLQPEFDARRPAKKYRYDSSLAPELRWDENAERVNYPLCGGRNITKEKGW